MGPQGGFDRLLALYERGLKVVFRHQFATLMVMIGTIVVTVTSMWSFPRASSPNRTPE
jgi:HAE1 family hydrophobic/amphiphilic exporter-1